MKSIFSLSKRPWLFSFLTLSFWFICNILVIVVLALILQLEDQTQVQAPWPTLLANLLMTLLQKLYFHRKGAKKAKKKYRQVFQTSKDFA